MVEETIQAVKETEDKAEEIIRDAKNRQKEILDQAAMDAQSRKEDYLAQIQANANQAAEEADAANRKLQAEEEQKTRAEVKLLKEMALRKREEAIKIVIDQMIS